MVDFPIVDRYPSQPQASTVTNMKFPADLNASSRNMYMIINLCTYDGESVLNSAQMQPFTSIALPIPLKLNDQTTVNWEEASITSMGASVASGILNYSKVGSTITQALGTFGQAAGSLASLYTGKTVNQFLVMLFKTQNFKEHVFQWIFAPKNQQESDALRNILEYFKASMLPSVYNGFGTAILNYPNIAQVNFSIPNGQTSYLYNFKPCAIVSAALDWSAGANPAFFEKSSAPVLVSLTLQLKEIELWFNSGPGTYV